MCGGGIDLRLVAGRRTPAINSTPTLRLQTRESTQAALAHRHVQRPVAPHLIHVLHLQLANPLRQLRHGMKHGPLLLLLLPLVSLRRLLTLLSPPIFRLRHVLGRARSMILPI